MPSLNIGALYDQSVQRRDQLLDQLLAQLLTSAPGEIQLNAHARHFTAELLREQTRYQVLRDQLETLNKPEEEMPHAPPTPPADRPIEPAAEPAPQPIYDDPGPDIADPG